MSDLVPVQVGDGGEVWMTPGQVLDYEQDRLIYGEAFLKLETQPDGRRVCIEVIDPETVEQYIGPRLQFVPQPPEAE